MAFCGINHRNIITHEDEATQHLLIPATEYRELIKKSIFADSLAEIISGKEYVDRDTLMPLIRTIYKDCGVIGYAE